VNDLIVKPTANKVAKPGRRAGFIQAGAGSDAGKADFSGVLETVDTVFGVPIPDNAIATMVCPKVEAHRRGTSYYRRKTGWIATPSEIKVFTADQPLQPQPNGKMRPAGDWGQPEVQVYSPVTPVTRRVGEVRDDNHQATTPTSAAAPPQEPPSTAIKAPETVGEAPSDLRIHKRLAEKFEHAASQVKYLPAKVRMSLIARVTDPVLYQAQMIGHYNGQDEAGNNKYTHYTIRALKMDNDNAIVVQAARQNGSPVWQVEKVDYQLSHNNALPKGRPTSQTIAR
jgi:hypothetical protein